jgi:hypothetical protein
VRMARAQGGARMAGLDGRSGAVTSPNGSGVAAQNKDRSSMSFSGSNEQ